MPTMTSCKQSVWVPLSTFYSVACFFLDRRVIPQVFVPMNTAKMYLSFNKTLKCYLHCYNPCTPNNAVEILQEENPIGRSVDSCLMK